MSDSPVREDLLHITKYEVLDSLPSLFRFEDGSSVKTPEDWKKRRKELYRTAIELQYGTLPPEPEFVEVELLFNGKLNASYRIITGPKSHPVSFIMRLVLPPSDTPIPCIVCGDMCFSYHMDKEYLSAATDHGIGWVMFNRTELAHDIKGEGRRKGQLYEAYPDYTFGAIGAWAWGYSRCVDALEILNRSNPQFDLSCITFTGHSRGGKTAALAGAVDERAAIVNPNETCAGACSCYRVRMEGYCDGIDHVMTRNETLEDLWNKFGFWMGPELGQYVGREKELPFDAHFLKALVAPRILFVSEAAGDIWANPIGSYQTTMAAKEAYRLLGAEENLYWYYRPGTHYHTVGDIEMLVNLICRKRDPSVPLDEKFFKRPFPEPKPIFDFY